MNQTTDFAQRRHSQIVDLLMDDYVSWREACAAVALAYENWRSAERQDRRLAFSVYLAALDREEQAAMTYQRDVEQVAATRPFEPQKPCLRP
jgi:hypothetical protein